MCERNAHVTRAFHQIDMALKTISIKYVAIEGRGLSEARRRTLLWRWWLCCSLVPLSQCTLALPFQVQAVSLAFDKAIIYLNLRLRKPRLQEQSLLLYS